MEGRRRRFLRRLDTDGGGAELSPAQRCLRRRGAEGDSSGGDDADAFHRSSDPCCRRFGAGAADRARGRTWGSSAFIELQGRVLSLLAVVRVSSPTQRRMARRRRALICSCQLKRGATDLAVTTPRPRLELDHHGDAQHKTPPLDSFLCRQGVSGLVPFWAGSLEGRSQIARDKLCDVGSFGLEGYFYRTSLFVPATLPARTFRSGWGVSRPNVRALLGSFYFICKLSSVFLYWALGLDLRHRLVIRLSVKGI